MPPAASVASAPHSVSETAETAEVVQPTLIATPDSYAALDSVETHAVIDVGVAVFANRMPTAMGSHAVTSDSATRSVLTSVSDSPGSLLLSDIPSQILKSPGQYAVLLNARAKRWTGDLHADIQRWISPKDLFLTDDFAQAERTVDRLIKDGYDFIFTGGGDGTISYLINAIEKRIRSGMVARSDAPGVGVLRMGTGNALASYVEAGNIVDDLRRLKEGGPLVVYDVQMVDCREGLFPFVGFGWDGLILNDYDALKDAVRGSAAENYVTGLGGYALSIATRSIPNALRVGAVPLVLTALDHCVEIDPDGREIAEFGPDEIMVQRDVKVCGCGTIPYWGFKVRMFPQCSQKPGYFQLRVYWGSISWILRHLRAFWTGALEPGMYRDFLCKEVRCEFPDEPLAYQVGGDAKGFERRVEWKTSSFPAKLAVPLR